MLPRDVKNLCHRPDHGFEARLLPLSQRAFPWRRACQAHAPLFECTSAASFPNSIIKHGVLELIFFLLHCLFSVADSVQVRGLYAVN